MKASANAKEVKLFPNNDGMFFELLAGRADAAFFDLPVVQEYANTAGKGKVKVVGPVYEGQSYGIAFPKASQLEEYLKMLEEAQKRGALPYPVGAESKYEIPPLFYRLSGTFRQANPQSEHCAIRINPNRSGEETVLRILRESIASI